MRRLLALAVAVAALTGCGGGDTATTTPAPSGTATATATTPTGIETAARGTATVATIRPGAKQLIARAEPTSTAKPAATLPARSRFDSPTTLLVAGGQPGWLRVQLPTRPNGSTGWVQIADVTVTTTADTIMVDLAKRTITITIGGETKTGPAGIGSKANPTPTGRFFVTDRVRPPKGSPYGSFALGTSAHSTTLSEFGGGDAQVGIHGTNDPASVGKDVSHGCVRVDADMTKLLERVSIGTPVTVH